MSDRKYVEELWARFLGGERLAPEEEGMLLEAFRADADFRREVLDDAESDGLLGALDDSSDNGEAFLKAFFERQATEKDATRFIRKVEAGMRAPRRTRRFRLE